MKIKLWDYSTCFGNIKGIICPQYSFYWILLSGIYYFFIHPKILEWLYWFTNNISFSGFLEHNAIISPINGEIKKLAANAQPNPIFLLEPMLPTIKERIMRTIKNPASINNQIYKFIFSLSIASSFSFCNSL